jgi:hypothetical protein
MAARRSASGRLEPALRRALAREPIEPAWPVLGPLAALVAGWVVMTWPWLSGQVTIPWDAKAHFQPQIQFLAQSLHRGEWPWWTPHVFAGHPQIADPQSMLFSPPVLLLAAVNPAPSSWAVDVMVLLVQLAGAVCLLLWVRDQGWHWAGAILGGLVFCFGAAMAWRLQHTGQVLSLAYWPMALLALDRTLRLGSYRWGVLAGLIGAAIVLGRDQVALLCVYLLAGFVLWRWFDADDRRALVRSSIGPLMAGGVLAAALVLVPILLTSLLAAESNRPSIDFEGAGRGSLHPALALTWLLPQLFGAAGRMEDYWGPPSFAWYDTGLFIAQNMGQLYIGAIPVLLLLLAGARGRFLDREARFFAAAFILVLLYALGWYTPAFRVFYEVLPGVKFYRRPADAVFLIGALSAVLTAYAAHRLFTRPWEPLGEHAVAITAGVVAVAFVAAAILGLWLQRTPLLPWPLLLGAIACVGGAGAIAFAKPRIALQPVPMAAVLVALTTIDLAWNNGPSTSSALPPATYAALEPDTADPVVRAVKAQLAAAAAEAPSPARRDRMEFMGVGFHWPNVSLAHGLENTLGYNPVRLGLYARATGAQDHIGLPEQRQFSPLFPSYRSLLSDMLGLRVIAAGAPLERHDKGLKPGDFRLVETIGAVSIYDNPRAHPRVRMLTRADSADFEALLRNGNWPAGFDPSRTVLLDQTSGSVGKVAYVSMVAAAEPATARLVAYGNTEIVVDAESPRGGWLLLNDPWHPWWFAETANGHPLEVQRANVLFRAVELPPGKHTVRFRFRPLLGAWRQWRG